MYQTDAFYCCIIMAVIVVGALPCHPFTLHVNCAQKLAFANSPTHHPPMLQRGFENMPFDNLCAHCESHVL